MAPGSLNIRPIVRVGGAPLGVALLPLLQSVEVESGTDAADSCLLSFADPARDVLDRLGIGFYDEIQVDAPRPGTAEPEPLFRGLVCALEIDSDDRGVRAVVQAFDHSFQLRQGRNTRMFTNVTDADAVKVVAEDAGVALGEIVSPGLVHEQLAQVNESDWEFLRRRASAIDHEVSVIDGKLHFRRSTTSKRAPAPGTWASRDRLQLIPGGNVRQLRGRVTAAQQSVEAEVRGWDPRTKRAVIAVSTAASRGSALRHSPDELAGGGTTTPRSLHCRPDLATQAECDAAAASEGERIGSSFVVLDGTASGDPKLRAGIAVSLGRAGALDGRYTLSSATHRFGSGGYTTDFVVSGQHDRSLFGLIGGDERQGEHVWPGVYPAIVTSTADPEHLGRVKLNYPWLAGEFESDWARLAQTGAGPERGLCWIPEVDDEVLVAFVAGDSSRPVVVGGLHNGKDSVPFSDAVAKNDGKVIRRGLRTRAGHTLLLTDEKGKECIELSTADSSIRMTLDQAGTKLAIDAGKNVDLVVTAGGKGNLTLESTSGDVEIKGRNLKLIGASGDVTVEGRKIKLN